MSGQNDEGKHGDEWEAPIARLWEMEEKVAGGKVRHPDVALLRLRTQAMAVMREIRGGSDDWKKEELLDYAPVPIMETGINVLKAWMNHDVLFFDELARVAAILMRKRRRKKGSLPNEAVVIYTAFELAREGVNPTREQVIKAVEKKGVKISDWTKTWKNCRLEFLKLEHRGRPKGRKNV